MFRVATFNVKSLPLMPQEDVIADTLLAGREADVILWQEIGPDRYKAAIGGLHELGFDTYMPAHVGGSEPISWRRDMFDLVDAGFELLHAGRKGVCADRGITWALLRRKGSKRTVLFHNVHYVPRAFAPDGTIRARRDRREAVEQPMRQAMWKDGNQRHKEFISGWLKKGHTVIGGGDFNRSGHVKVVGNTFANATGNYGVHYLNNDGLDYIFIIPNRNTKFIHRWSHRFAVNSDHALRVSGLSLYRKSIFKRR